MFKDLLLVHVASGTRLAIVSATATSSSYTHRHVVLFRSHSHLHDCGMTISDESWWVSLGTTAKFYTLFFTL